MPEDELALRGRISESDQNERLQESAVDVASILGAAAGVGSLGLTALQMYHQRHSADPGDAVAEVPPVDDYDPGFAGSQDYDPGFSRKADSVLDLTLDDDSPYGRGGQEYYPGFEDLDY